MLNRTSDLPSQSFLKKGVDKSADVYLPPAAEDILSSLQRRSDLPRVTTSIPMIQEMYCIVNIPSPGCGRVDRPSGTEHTRSKVTQSPMITVVRRRQDLKRH